MVWKRILNYHNTGFGIFLLVSVLVFFFSFSLDIHNTFAVSDLTYTFDFSNIPSWYDLCTSSTCPSYHYIFVEPSNPYSCSGASGFYVYGLNVANVSVSACVPSVIFLDPSSTSAIGLTGGSQVGSGYSGNITITLSETLSSGQPSGSITLSQNGTYDVSSYAEAVVDVPPEVVQGDYHDDLVNVTQAIYVSAAVLLVLYFFYCIYGMIIKSTGGK